MKKKLIIINGAPGVGKTTITNSLREQTDITIIEKDAIKEFYFDYVGIGDREWSRALGKASIDAVFSLADQLFHIKDVLLLETAFYALATRQDLKTLAIHHDFEVLELYCRLDELTRRERYTERARNNRHPGHADLLASSEAADNINRYVPLNVGQIIEIDTSKDVDINSVLAAVEAFIQDET